MDQRDTYQTAKGPLAVVPIHHATLAMEWDGRTVLFDPVGGADRFAAFAPADLIVLTHHHADHFEIETLDAVVAPATRLVAPAIVYAQLPPAIAEKTVEMANGDVTELLGITITAIPMYNTTPDRQKYHEKGVGNGYLLDFAGTRVYLASDTEPHETMDTLGEIDIAFFPMNLPYTMTPEQVVQAIGKTRPRYAYPFHYRFPFDMPGTEPQALIDIMPDGIETEIVARDWYADR